MHEALTDSAMMQAPSDEELELEIAERLHIFASRLQRLCSEQVAKKNQIEQRWLDDLRQYHGEYAADESAKLARQKGSEVFVNITRNKTNAAEARLQDMLFPTDDRNFGLYATPVPELDYISKQQPEAPDEEEPIQQARDIKAAATEAALAMQEVIDDQLLESRYHIKARDVIHDACQLGTAVIKGPIIIGRTKKRWDVMPDGMSVLQIVEALEPTIERVDPWDFFPDMSAKSVDEAEFVFERRRLSKKPRRVGRLETANATPFLRKMRRLARAPMSSATRVPTGNARLVGCKCVCAGGRWERR